MEEDSMKKMHGIRLKADAYFSQGKQETPATSPRREDFRPCDAPESIWLRRHPEVCPDRCVDCCSTLRLTEPLGHERTQEYLGRLKNGW